MSLSRIAELASSFSKCFYCKIVGLCSLTKIDSNTLDNLCSLTQKLAKRKRSLTKFVQSVRMHCGYGTDRSLFEFVKKKGDTNVVFGWALSEHFFAKMFGVGTDKVKVEQFKHHFVSGLGTNNQSWGFSYNGMKQHNGEQIPYGNKFSQGCIVGIYLDLTRGHLEFFLNRRSLGIAYTNIPIDPNIQIYPMVCSTAAKSAIRLINSTSQVECLQLRSFQALSKQPTLLAELKEMPGFRSLLKSYWFFVPTTRYSSRSTNNEIDIGDEAVLSSSRLARKQKFKDEEPDLNDLYTNAHKIAMHNFTESDDEFSVDDLFYYLF